MQALSQLSYTPFKLLSTACNLYRFVFGVALFNERRDDGVSTIESDQFAVPFV